MNKKALLGLVFSIVVIVAVMAYLPFPVGPVGAQDTGTIENELRGWAWSDSTGWVSFNHEGTDGMSSSGGTSSGSTEYKMPSSATQKIKAPGSLTWVSPILSLNEDGTFTTAYIEDDSQSTNYLENRGFGLSLPAGANVTGIEMCYKRASEQSGLADTRVHDENIQLIKPNGSYSLDNKSQGTQWSENHLIELGWVCYGGPGDTWGESWTSTDIANPYFGTVISASLTADRNGSGKITLYIDAVKVKVYYDEPAGSPASSGSDYAVTVDQNGNLTGYAWSLNLGWIKFAPELYPTGVCGATNDCYGAKIVEGGTIDEVKGWARVCSVYQSGCSGTLRSDAELGGWDGWIKMHNVKRQANGGFYGYAWGDLNLAWLDLGFGDVGDGTDVCNPNEQVCGGEADACVGLTGDALTCCLDSNDPVCPGNGDNVVTVVVTGSGCSNSTVEFIPPGEECGSGTYCRTYDTEENVSVKFTEQIPDSVTGCPEGGYTKNETEGVCAITGIDTNYNLIANCNTTDIANCKLSFTDGVPLTLSEGLFTTYPALSNSGIGKLALLDSGVPCAGITYNLDSRVYKLVGGSKEPTPDSNVTLACKRVTDSVYLPANCSNLDGKATTNVKAYFNSRPTDRAAKWSLEMTAISTEDGTPSQTFNIPNQLIQYFARTGAR